MSMPSDSATVFNTALSAAAVGAAFRLGLLEELQAHGSFVLEDFLARRDLDRPSLSNLVVALEKIGVVVFDRQADRLATGPSFDDFRRNQGYFYWLSSGYGPMLQRLSELLHRDADIEPSRVRNAPDIAIAARDYGQRFVDPLFARLVGEAAPRVVADIGCGSAGRLVEIGREYPTLRGYGIEIDPQVGSAARRALREAGLADRFEIVVGDIGELEQRPGFEAVDLLFSFFVGHDFWPRNRCARVLADLRALFPTAQRFLLCDTYRSDALDADDLPIFTLGFELTHALMRQHVPSRGEWLDLFEETGWECADIKDVGIPYSSIFDLRKMQSRSTTSRP